MLTIEERAPATLQLHESADLIPRMRPEEWNAFLEDVDAQGVLEPLVITEAGVILDGRHRWEAAKTCQQETVPVRVVHLTTVEQVQYIFRAALLRRHLNDDQRAVLAARFREPLSKAMQSEAGQKANAVRWHGDRSDLANVTQTDDAPGPTPPTNTRRMVSEQFNVPERKVRQAITLEHESPRLAEQVLAGDVSLREAQREQAKAAALELGNLEVQAGIDKRQDVQRQRLRRKFADTMYALGEIDPAELVAAYSERDRETLPAYLQQLREWGERVDTLAHDPTLRVLEGGRSS